MNAVRSRRPIRALALVALVTGLVLAYVLPAAASHPEVSLPGSNFEIDTDANLKVDDAGSLDWANVNEVRKDDKPTGQTDDSFGQGTKEDTPVPTVVDGSIPNNKSDLLNFGVYQETTASGRNFMHMFWHRVQEPTGTTNMDFEFNQSTTTSSNGVTPVRTAGDLLIQYDLAQGGTNPQLFLSRWVASGPKSQCQAANATPCWGTRVNLTSAGAATGSINTSAIPAAEADGLGAISPRTFGEASVDLDAILGGTTACVAFGSAYLKSRASDAFTAELKDFIAPAPVNINLCGSVKIIKTDDAGTPLAGAEFTLYKDNPPIGGSRGSEDTITALKCTTAADGTCTISNVFKGEYWVVETVVPPGHQGVVDQHVTVVANQTVTVGPLENPRLRGAILVTKTRKHAAAGSGDHPHAGVDFTVNGVTKTTDATGKACFDNLLFGSYTVHETTPAGYHGEADKTVTVDNKASCTDNPYVGETVDFHNTPLTNLTVSVDSQVDGGTASTIECKKGTATVASGSTGANGDGSASASDLEPGTYTCTVVIDP